MKTRTVLKKTSKNARGKLSVGEEIIASLKEAVAWASGENVPVRVTTVQVPTTDEQSSC
jgi:hypothetical protein